MSFHLVIFLNILISCTKVYWVIPTRSSSWPTLQTCCKQNMSQKIKLLIFYEPKKWIIFNYSCPAALPYSSPLPKFSFWTKNAYQKIKSRKLIKIFWDYPANTVMKSATWGTSFTFATVNPKNNKNPSKCLQENKSTNMISKLNFILR